MITESMIDDYLRKSQKYLNSKGATIPDIDSLPPHILAEARASSRAMMESCVEIIGPHIRNAALQEAVEKAKDAAASTTGRELDNDSHWGPIYRSRIAEAIDSLKTKVTP